MLEKPSFEERLINSLARISNSISGLVFQLKLIDEHKRFPVGPLKPSKEYEKAMKERRQEKREEGQIDILLKDHKEMVRQSRYMFWAVVVAAIAIAASVLLKIVEMVYLHPTGLNNGSL